MNQPEIDKIMEKILSLNTDKEKVYEFICACKNAVSLIENKLQVNHMKIAYKASINSLINNIGK